MFSSIKIVIRNLLKGSSPCNISASVTTAVTLTPSQSIFTTLQDNKDLKENHKNLKEAKINEGVEDKISNNSTSKKSSILDDENSPARMEFHENLNSSVFDFYLDRNIVLITIICKYYVATFKDPLYLMFVSISIVVFNKV